MTFSIIIPALNEGENIAKTIANVRSQGAGEIIVIDGGSSDNTMAQAREADLVLAGPRGRARQMNFGAAHATHRYYLFLHADCLLQEHALTSAIYALDRGKILAGCFQMTVPISGLLYRSIERCATIRVQRTGIIYGDQGLFVAKKTFERVGGFPETKLMEDVFFSNRIRKLGGVEVLKKRIFVSPRRWQKVGLLRQTLHNWTLTGLALAGIHPDHLAKYYPVVR